MLGVAIVMVGHTLRYRSQVVTGLAFLLAFLTVSISHSNVYSLTAGGVLAAGLVFIVLRMQWFELEIFGILASYFNHFLWLRPIIEPMNGHRRPFREFAASAALLVVYWLIFRVSYVLRKPREERQERISTVAALLNTTLLLLLFKQLSFWDAKSVAGHRSCGDGRRPVVSPEEPTQRGHRALHFRGGPADRSVSLPVFGIAIVHPLAARGRSVTSYRRVDARNRIPPPGNVGNATRVGTVLCL